MKLKKYVYTGPDSSVTLVLAAAIAATETAVAVPAKHLEVLLRQGVELDLPDDNDVVKTLEAKGFLKAAVASTGLATATPTNTDTSTVKTAGKK